MTPNDQLAYLVGLYNGDPAGSGFTGLEEIKDPAGINFRLRDPPLLMAEAQYNYNQEKTAQGLAGTIKLGGWRHFGKFDDVHFDVDGNSLAAPSSNGVARTHSGELWHLRRHRPDALAPAGRRSEERNWRVRTCNMQSFRVAIVIWLISMPRRALNLWGFGTSVRTTVLASRHPSAQLSPSLRELDLEKAFFEKTALPLRDYELVVELTYQAQIVAGWTIQPDFQYIFHPGGGVISHLIVLSGRSPTPPFLVCARRSAFRAG